MTGRIAAVNRSNGGVPKLSIDSARVSFSGLQGDKQRDRRFHGGPERALCLYSLERIDALIAEGHPVSPGALGENITIAGIDWSMMRRGVRLCLGTVEVELTSFAAPCKTIRHCFLDEEFTRISEKVHSGWSRVYARVLREGDVSVGDVVTMSSRA